MSLFHARPELLAAFAAGRREVLDEVYRVYRPAVDAYLRMLVAGSSYSPARGIVVADLRQEVFLRAFSPQARAAYDPERRYAPYLMRIARNCFIDELRSFRQELRLSRFGEGLGSEAVESEGIEAGDPGLAAIVQRYLIGLPPELRAVYDRRYVCDESQMSACEALGLSRRRLRTAEERLKRGLRRELVLSGCFEGQRPPTPGKKRALSAMAVGG
jgi:RNA polymerase sigma factor (sigma-70 family)